MTDRVVDRYRRTRLLVPARAVSLGAPLIVGLAALHLSWLVFGWGGEAHRVLLSSLLSLAPSVVAAPTVLSAALLHRGRARRGWVLIGLGLAAQALGAGIWTYLDLVLKTEPFPSSADLFFLMFGPLLAAGLLQLMPPARDRLEGSRLALDLAVSVSALGLFFWRYLLAPPLAWGMDGWTTGVTLAYPLFDLLLLGLLLLLVLRERRELPRPELLLMGLALAAQVAADLLNTAALATDTYYTGHPLNLLWTLSTTLLVLAAAASLTQRRAPVSRGVATLHGQLAVALPYLAVAAGFGLLLMTETDPVTHDTLAGRGVLYGAVAVTLLVVWRQLLAFHENWRLAQHLERQSATLELRVQARTADLEALSRRYRHDALHDALTGLPNRAQFQKQLRRVVDGGRPFAVLYLDFDRFKTVNDSFGHAVGDALLIAIGKQLETSVRPGDLVARLGGDEFAVLLEEVAEGEEAVRIAERLTGVFQEPFELDGHTLPCTASIGVVVGSGQSSAESVLRDADIALYRAKASGRSQHVVFAPSMREGLQARLALEADLRGAVARSELEVHYQPVVRAADGSVAGFEALVRWRHPQRGLVPPAEFVPVAEETGLIIDIDRWVLKTACAQLRAWSGISPQLGLSVNLSSRQFSQTDLAPFVAGVLAECQLAPHRLKLELTEGLLMDTTPTVQETLASLKRLGVRLHIDDFGTGYSSLSYLQRFHADALKIDRSFVIRMLENGGSAELVRTIINMAHNLGMQVVAEGVESEAQRLRLKALGCEYVQGYLFSKPVPAAAAALMLRRGSTVTAV